jgi:exopolysaccharide biosynthesis polyprenyl glycosylphosphotransferase
LLPGVVTHCHFSAASNPVTDMLLVGLSFGAAFEFNNLLNRTFARAFSWQSPGPPVAGPQWGMIPVLAALVSLLNCSEGLYSGMTPSRQQVRSTLAKSVAWAILLISATVLSSAHHPLRAGAVVAGGFLAYGALWTWRKWRWWRTAQRRARGQGRRNVLIVGAGSLGREVAEALSRDFEGERVLAGFLDENVPVDGEIRGRPEDLTTIARAHFVDEVILAIPNQPGLAHRVAREARRCRLDIRTVPELLGQSRYGGVEHLGHLPLLTVHQEPVPILGPLLKRAFDVVSSAAALLVAAPLFAGIAAAVKLDSPGPVFYRAPRAGRKGRTFPCFKFRTMTADADSLKEALRERNERCGPFFKISDDPRITRLGRLLRRYSLDELPQLWNVLRGEMSMVGPRPHPLDDCRRYQLEYLRRLDVSPGITGLWQVTARHDSSFQRGLALDLYYIEHWNFWIDLRILCKTAAVVLEGSGK